LHVEKFALYFMLMLGISAIYHAMNGGGMAAIASSLLWQVPLVLIALAILTGVGYLYARSTVYTLTNRRMVIRSGIVTPMMVNLPLESMESAGLRACGDGTGDVLLTMKPNTRKLFYVLLWPNVRPWHFRPVKPLLRGIEEPEALADALRRVVQELKLEDNTPRAQTTRPVGSASSDGYHGDLSAHV
jgi:hypothetical protein